MILDRVESNQNEKYLQQVRLLPPCNLLLFQPDVWHCLTSRYVKKRQPELSAGIHAVVGA